MLASPFPGQSRGVFHVFRGHLLPSASCTVMFDEFSCP